MTRTTRWLLRFARLPAAAAAVVGLGWLLASTPRAPATSTPPRCYDPDLVIGGRAAMAPRTLCPGAYSCEDDGTLRDAPAPACR